MNLRRANELVAELFQGAYCETYRDGRSFVRRVVMPGKGSVSYPDLVRWPWASIVEDVRRIKRTYAADRVIAFGRVGWRHPWGSE